MCQHRRYIRNIYTHNYVLVDCGHCKSCLQKKAAKRATRIRNNSNGSLCLFVTLTYDNAGIPFVLRDDLVNRKSDIPVYRHCVSRNMRYGSTYDFKLRRTFGKFEIATLHLDYDKIDDTSIYDNEVKRLKSIKHMPDKIGICYYPDLQNFMKRLRQNLQRKYNYYGKFTSFQCSEYGGHSQRPHFHVLFFIEPSSETAFRSAIVESWPFGNFFKQGRFIEIARDAASYVASYVNGGSNLSKILEDSEIRQKHSSSKDFGVTLDAFKLSSLLEKVRNGACTYSRERIVDGKSEFAVLPVPKYVINRYFPRFKGIGNLNSSEIIECIQCPQKLYYQFSLDYSKDDCYKTIVRLNHAYQYYRDNVGGTIYDYAIDFVRTWNNYFKTSLELSYRSVMRLSDWLSFYDNGGIMNHKLVSPNLGDLLDKYLGGNYYFEENPNSVLGLREQDSYLEDLYNKKTKQKDVTNYVMSDGLGLDV